jgi:ABC-type uncharacterized transport system involved in gliding motility auxiliary subunit
MKLLPDTVAADRQAARRVAVPVAAGGTQTFDYVAWVNLRDGDLNHDDVITANLRQVTMATAGILEPLPGAATKLEPLITTSRDAMKLPVTKIVGLPDIVGLLTRFKPEDTNYVLAARVTGPAETAFPEGPPKADDKSAGKPTDPANVNPVVSPPQQAEDRKTAEFLRKSVQPINIVVVADTDMLDDRFWAQSREFFGRQVVVPVAGNGDFVVNAIDVLAGGEDLVGLRSRGTSVRPFEVVEQIQRATDEHYAAERSALEKKLEQTQAKLRDMTAGEQPGGSPTLAPEQAQAADQFRADLVETRRELRAVQAALRQDIAALKLILEFCDIALVPILVAVAAIILGMLRLRRWRRRPTAPV